MQNNQILFSVMKILNILEAMNKIKLFYLYYIIK